jgi:hypothetical protein
MPLATPSTDRVDSTPAQPSVSRRHAAAITAVVAVHLALVAWSAARNAPTWDEPAHVVAGLAHLQHGDFRPFRVNPPLVHVVAALPLLAAGQGLLAPGPDPRPGQRIEFSMAQQWVRSVGGRVFALVTRARWACLPFTLLGMLACAAWARELFGARAGVLAVVLWCVDPTILAHAPLVTSDLAGAAFGLATTWLAWRWAREPSWRRAAATGASLGLALLCKGTWLVLVLALPLAWLASRPPRVRAWRSEASQLLAASGLALLVLHAGYGFSGTLRPLRSYSFVSKALGGEAAGGPERRAGNRFADTWLGSLHVPLPADFVLGLDTQSRTFEHGTVSYLRGEYRAGGWWWYYLYGLAVKVPLGTWILLGLSVATAAARWRTGWPDAAWLLVVPAAVLATVSASAPAGGHVRYALVPVMPFVIVAASRLADAWRERRRGVAVVAGLALAWSMAGSLRVLPCSLAYFNELAGGPRRGGEHLLDSNVDWGQDLLELKRWANAHPEARPLSVAYFGFVEPALAGLPSALPPTRGEGGPTAGWHAVSVNYLHGYQVPVMTAAGPRRVGPDDWTYLRDMAPVAWAGHSIAIYHVTGAEVPSAPP